MGQIKKLILGDLKVPYPIIQGGMGIGISLSSLAGSVAAEGGIGLLSTAQIGFKEPDFFQHPLKANQRAIGKGLWEARNKAKDSKGAVGFNIMVATHGYETYVREAIKCYADLVVCGAGVPLLLPALRQEGMLDRGTLSEEEHRKWRHLARTEKTKIAPIVSSGKSASVVLKLWDRKYQETADLVILEGPLAGGHLGFSLEQLAGYGADTDRVSKTYKRALFDEDVRQVIEAVKPYKEKYQKEIPVVVAGGIYDRADLLHVLSLGADGVQVGTRFVTTEECDAPLSYKMTYIHAREQDIRIVKSPVGLPGRGINNAFLKFVAEQKKTAGHCWQCLSKCDRKNIPYCITEALLAAAEGRVEEALLFCGANAWRANKIETVQEVMNDFFWEE